jgi:hypothetical protein
MTMATVAGASLLLIACRGGQNPSASPPATPADSVEQSQSSSPSDDPSASPSVAPTGEVLEGFHLDDILRVEVNSLAVRVKPYTTEPLATGSVFDGTKLNVIGPVRLNVGDYVSVELGPVKIGDTTWYRVWPAEGGRLHYSLTSWDTNGQVDDGMEPAWVAASVGSDVYLKLHEASEPEPWMSGLPLLVSGSGNYVSGPLQSTDLFTLDWVYLIDNQPTPCTFRITLGPIGGADGVVVVDESTISFGFAARGLGEADATSVAGKGVDPFELRVVSGCEWALRLEPQPHD